MLSRALGALRGRSQRGRAEPVGEDRWSDFEVLMYTGNLIGGRYRLTRRIGAGNMGVVFEVEDQQAGRRVALKQVLYGGKEHQQRLLREARVCQRLRHPNIIEVLDIGVTDTGAPFLVMPLLTGETIADLLKRKRRVAPMLAAQVGRDIATALAAAHAEGIIHRDLKPANVFIHRPGKAERPIIKVLDFGVCKEVNSKMTVLTSAGNVVGTPAYMRPFRGEGVELFLKILNGEIPTVSQLVRSVPSRLADLVARCLTRDRAARIGSAEEVVAELDGLLQESAATSAGGSLTEQAGSTSSGMATHLGSQTVSGSVLVEAGAATLGALAPRGIPRPHPLDVTSNAASSADSAPMIDPPEAATAVGGPGVGESEREASGAATHHDPAIDSGAAELGLQADASIITASSLLYREEALFLGRLEDEDASTMALSSDALAGVPHRTLLVIGAGALMLGLAVMGLYATVSSAPRQTVAIAMDLPSLPLSSMAMPLPLEAKATEAPDREHSPSSSLRALNDERTSSARLRAPLRKSPSTPPQSAIGITPTRGAASPAGAQAASIAVRSASAKSTTASAGARSEKSPPSGVKSCGGAVVKRCMEF
jgi:serine/threonine-protein kinase